MDHTAKVQCCACEKKFHIQIEPTFKTDAPLVKKAVDCPYCGEGLILEIREDQAVGRDVLRSLSVGSGDSKNRLNEESIPRDLFLKQAFPTTLAPKKEETS